MEVGENSAAAAAVRLMSNRWQTFEGICRPHEPIVNVAVGFQNRPHKNTSAATPNTRLNQVARDPALQNMRDETVFPGMLAAFSAGTALPLLARDTEPPLREVLESQGVRSMALMPVRSHGEFLGFIGFDDCRTERIWKGEELESLRAAAAGARKILNRFFMGFAPREFQTIRAPS